MYTTTVMSWHSTESASDIPSATSVSEESRCDRGVLGWRLRTGRDAAETAQSRAVTQDTAAALAPAPDLGHWDEGSTETVHSVSTPSHAP